MTSSWLPDLNLLSAKVIQIDKRPVLPNRYLSESPGVPFTTEVNMKLARRPLVFNGRLANRWLNSFKGGGAQEISSNHS